MSRDSTQNPMNAAVRSRNLALAHASPRCGARTRAGLPCKAQAMRNGRCYRHGGPSTGPRKLDFPNAGLGCQIASNSAPLWSAPLGMDILSEGN